MANFRTLTVADLIDLLQDQDPDTKVIFSTNYGDYCRTSQALPLQGECEEVTIRESGYSNSGFAVNENDEDDYDEETGEPVESASEKFLLIR